MEIRRSKVNPWQAQIKISILFSLIFGIFFDLFDLFDFFNFIYLFYFILFYFLRETKYFKKLH